MIFIGQFVAGDPSVRHGDPAYSCYSPSSPGPRAGAEGQHAWKGLLIEDLKW